MDKLSGSVYANEDIKQIPFIRTYKESLMKDKGKAKKINFRK